jgi:pimeloyl-ACP methyl ester carboxylesterase
MGGRRLRAVLMIRPTPDTGLEFLPEPHRSVGTDGAITLEDGRRLTYRVFGTPLATDGTRPVIALHGTPGSRFKYAPADAEASRLGLTLIAVDRWGYGGTDAPRVQSVAGFAKDIEALADHLGLDTFDLVGISGGGPYAAAVAAELGQRVRRAALVAPVGIVTTRAGRVAKMRAFHRFCFRALPRVPRVVRRVFQVYAWILRNRPRLAISLAMARSGPADRQLLDRPDVVAGLAGMMRVGLRSGARGPEIDLKLFRGPWDVDTADVTAETCVWFGDQDGSVPRGAIDELVAAVPGCRLELKKGQGHFWVVTQFPLVLAWLARPETIQWTPADAPTE